MQAVQGVSFFEFLDAYELQLQQEFIKDGVPAQWAPGASASRLWGAEDHSVVVADSNRHKLERFSAAFSPDEKFLAVSLDQRIKVYDLYSREQKADVLGHERPIEELHWLTLTEAQCAYGPGAAYLLFVQGKRRDLKSTLVTLPVDAQGGIVDTIFPLDVSKMVNDAMQSLSTHLAPHDDIDEADTLNLRAQLEQALDRLNLKRREKRSLVFPGRFPRLDSTIFSKDGRKFIYIAHGSSTQQRMRPADELPQIIVWDLTARAEVCRLKGHTDAIMWAAWALGDQSIVTASWDGWFKIWDSETGECRRNVGPTGRQNWTGAVSPDDELVLLSGGGELGVFMVSSGIKVMDIDRSDFFGDHTQSYRENSWSPDGNAIAIANQRKMLLADPKTGLCRVILEYEYDGTRVMRNYATFCTPQWADGGRKLIVRGSEKTLFVWDRERNWKWRFQRPTGTKVDQHEHQVCYLRNLNTIVSVTEDYTVRWWKL